MAYPITSPFTNTLALAGTLWRSRFLLGGQWEGYNRFTAHHGLNSLFYWTSALHVWRHGRGGVSPYLGLGNYKLGSWFFYSLVSLMAYWRLAPLLPVLGLATWLFGHAVWSIQVDPTRVTLVIVLLLISSTWFAQAFLHQNYNAAGWAFFPIGLFGVTQGHWLVAALAWLAASLGSFTAVTLAAPVCLAQSLITASPLPFLTALPACLKLASHLLWGDRFEFVGRVARSIGFVRQGALYLMAPPTITMRTAYYLILYCPFCGLTWYWSNPWWPLLLTGLLLFLINARFARFADDYSLNILMVSLAAGAMMQSQQDWLWVSFWLVASPLPLVECGACRCRASDRLPVLEPFRVGTLIEAMQRFLNPVQAGQKILMAFEDPGTVYGKIFDGYRVLLELPAHVCALRGIHWMPDWWTVIATNYPGAPPLWGRSAEEVRANAELWNADFVIVYGEVPPLGWEVVGRFDWSEFPRVVAERPFSGSVPVWWLLKVQSGNSLR